MRRLVEINSAMSTWTYNQNQRKVEEFNLDSIKQSITNGDTVYRIHQKQNITWANPYVSNSKGQIRIDLAPFPSQTWKSDMASIITQAREIYREQLSTPTKESTSKTIDEWYNELKSSPVIGENPNLI